MAKSNIIGFVFLTAFYSTKTFVQLIIIQIKLYAYLNCGLTDYGKIIKITDLIDKIKGNKIRFPIFRKSVVFITKSIDIACVALS